MASFLSDNSYVFIVIIVVLVLLMYAVILCFCRSRRVRFLRSAADQFALDHTIKRLEDLDNFTTQCLDDTFAKAFPPVDEKDPAMRIILFDILKEVLKGTNIEVSDSVSRTASKTTSRSASMSPPLSPSKQKSHSTKKDKKHIDGTVELTTDDESAPSPTTSRTHSKVRDDSGKKKRTHSSKSADNHDDVGSVSPAESPFKRASSTTSSKGRSHTERKGSEAQSPRFVFKTTGVAVPDGGEGGLEGASRKRRLVAFEVTKIPSSTEIIQRLLHNRVLLSHCRRGGIAAYTALGRHVQKNGASVFDDVPVPKGEERSREQRRKEELEMATPQSMWGCWGCCCLTRSSQREYFHKRRRLYWFGLSSMFSTALNLKESDADVQRRLRNRDGGGRRGHDGGGGRDHQRGRNNTRFVPIPAPLEGHSGDAVEMSPVRGDASQGAKYSVPSHPPSDVSSPSVQATWKFNNMFLWMGGALSRKLVSVCPVVKDRISVVRHVSAAAPRLADDAGADTEPELHRSEFTVRIADHPDLLSESDTRRLLASIFQPPKPITEETAISDAYNTRLTRQHQSTSLMSATSSGVPVSGHLVVEGGISRTSSLARPTFSAQSTGATGGDHGGGMGGAMQPPPVITEHAVVAELQSLFPKGLPMVSDALDASHFSCDSVRDDLYVFYQNLHTTMLRGEGLDRERDYYPMYDAIPAFDEAIKKWYLQVCILAATTCARSFASMVASHAKKMCEKETRAVIKGVSRTTSRALDFGVSEGISVDAAEGAVNDSLGDLGASPPSTAAAAAGANDDEEKAIGADWQLHTEPSHRLVVDGIVQVVQKRLEQQLSVFRSCHVTGRYDLMRYEGGPVVDTLRRKSALRIRAAVDPKHYDENLLTPAMLLFPPHAGVLALHSANPLPLPRQLTQAQDVPLTIEDGKWFFGQGLDLLATSLASDELCMRDSRRKLKRLRKKLLDLLYRSSQVPASCVHNHAHHANEDEEPPLQFTPRNGDDDEPVPPPRSGGVPASPAPRRPLHPHPPPLGKAGLSIAEQAVIVTFRDLVTGLEANLKLWAELSEETVAGALIAHRPGGQDVLDGWQRMIDEIGPALVAHVSVRYDLLRTTVAQSLKTIQLALRAIYQYLSSGGGVVHHNPQDGAPSAHIPLPLRLPLPVPYVRESCADLLRATRELRKMVHEVAEGTRADLWRSGRSLDEHVADASADLPDPVALHAVLPYLRPTSYFNPADVLSIYEAACGVLGAGRLGAEDGSVDDLQPLPTNLFDGL